MATSADFINKPEDPLQEFNEEHQHQGAISSAVYKTYLKAVGRRLSVLVLISLFSMQASKNGSDLWLAHWVSQTDNSSSQVVTPSPIPPLFESYQFSGVELPMNASESMKYEFMKPVQETNVENEYEDSWVTGVGKYIPMVRDLGPNVRYYFVIFVIIGAVNSVCTLARAFLFAYGGVRGGTRIHLALLRVILKVRS
jgi:ATP-binding cassette subfamily C (CFTR/MRP) protein 10